VIGAAIAETAWIKPADLWRLLCGACSVKQVARSGHNQKRSPALSNLQRRSSTSQRTFCCMFYAGLCGDFMP
jgi:hypothetical protein